MIALTRVVPKGFCELQCDHLDLGSGDGAEDPSSLFTKFMKDLPNTQILAGHEPVALPSLVPDSSKFSSSHLFAKCSLEAALLYSQFKLKVVPFVRGKKQPSLKLKEWLEHYSPAAIAAHYEKRPYDDVGCVLDNDVIVFDVDSPAAQHAMDAIIQKFGLQPRLVIKTARGRHYYFRRAPDAYAKSDSHSTDEHPERIDVKAAGSFTCLPPSGNRYIEVLEVDSVDMLSTVSQEVIDAVALHNGRPPPRRLAPIEPSSMPDLVELTVIEQLLDSVSPNCGYDDWLDVLMAVFHATGGSPAGFELIDRWSVGGSTYSGTRELEAKWRSFRLDIPHPVTIATLIKMAKEAGANVGLILGREEFDIVETEVVYPTALGAMETDRVADDARPLAGVIPLEKFSLLGRLDAVERQTSRQLPLLGELALLGQATVFYAKSNTGKTLIVLRLLVDAIRRGAVVPAKVFYLNMDDNSTGLLEKARVADEYGFNMLADGHRDFEVKVFGEAMREMIRSDTAAGVVVVLDTLKKFANMMDKAASSGFARVLRQFVLKGGTVVALAHTNKNPGADGRAVFSGTTDFVDDLDCAYVVEALPQGPDAYVRTVEFTNIKRRGDVVLSVAYHSS